MASICAIILTRAKRYWNCERFGGEQRPCVWINFNFGFSYFSLHYFSQINCTNAISWLPRLSILITKLAVRDAAQRARSGWTSRCRVESINWPSDTERRAVKLVDGISWREMSGEDARIAAPVRWMERCQIWDTISDEYHVSVSLPSAICIRVLLACVPPAPRINYIHTSLIQSTFPSIIFRDLFMPFEKENESEMKEARKKRRMLAISMPAINVFVFAASPFRALRGFRPFHSFGGCVWRFRCAFRFASLGGDKLSALVSSSWR